MRIAGYALPVGEAAQAYVEAHLAEPNFRRWRAMGKAAGDRQTAYDMDLATGPWPGPVPLAAEAVSQGEALNAECPNSGKPVTHLMRVGDKTIGFCNAFCRDKTVADPEAWPKAMALLR